MNKDPRVQKQFLLWAAAVIFLFSIYQNSSQKSVAVKEPPPKEITANELREQISNKNVKQLYLKYPLVSADLKQPIYLARTVFFNSVNLQEFEEIRVLAKTENIPYKLIPDAPVNYFKDVGVWLIMQVGGIILFFVVWIFMMKRMTGGKGGLEGGGGGTFGFGKSKAKHYQSTQDKKTFADVAGCDEAKEEVKEIVEFLKNPIGFSRLGARIPRGILLYGAPGTGKTLIAKAVAGEAGVKFLYANGSDFIEMFVGVGASRVNDLFNTAKELAPCVVFIDEIDAVGKKRGVAIGGGHDEREQTLDALLGELDGFEKNYGIIVMAATNRPDILDEALVRPGRFDRQIEVPSPDLSGREMILKIHSRNITLGTDVDLLHIAKDTAGMVGADLENMVNEAALIATRKKKSAVSQSDFSEAVDKVSMGPMRKSIKLSEKEKKTIAYHEAGHTLAAMLIPGADKVHKVTIIPRGRALGFTKQLPEDRHSITKSQLEAMVAVCVGGRVAEELVMGEITTGHCDDFKKATGILKKMIYELGMDDEAGMAVYEEKTDFWGNPTGLDASQKTKELLEKVLKNKLEETYQKVKKLLTDNKNKLDAIAKALLEKETLESRDLDLIMQFFKY